MSWAAFLALAAIASPAAALESGVKTQVEISTTYSVSSTVIKVAERQSWIGRKSAPLVDLFQRGILKAYDVELKLAQGARRQWFRWFPPVPPLPAEVALANFEEPTAFGWTTGGYVELHVSSLHATEGSSSCRATFLLATDMTVSPRGSAWQPTMSLNMPPAGVAAPLPLTDWSLFRDLKADIFNDTSVAVPLTFTILDIKGYRFEETRRLDPKAEASLEISLDKAREARLDLSNVLLVSLSVDAAGMKERPVLFIDNLRCSISRPGESSTPVSVKPEGPPAPGDARGGK